MQEIFWVDIENLFGFETGWVDAFSGFDAEVETTDWTKDLVYSTDSGFIFQINSSIEFRESCWICAFHNKLILASMQECTVWNDKCWWSLLLLESSTWSWSSASAASSEIGWSPIVVTLIFFTHDLIIIFFID